MGDYQGQSRYIYNTCNSGLFQNTTTKYFNCGEKFFPRYIEDLKKDFKATRPDGTEEVIISRNYKIMTYFPNSEKYCMTVMYDNNWKLLQWYFDIERYKCKYDLGIPYSEDLYLDVVVLPNGKFYTLDEEELKQALNNNLISKDEYNMAYLTMNKIILMIKNDFTKLYNFTNKSLENLK